MLNIKIKGMKKVIIDPNYAGLVFKNGELKRVLTAGTYWLGWSEHIGIYDMSKPFSSIKNLDVLLQNSDLENLLHVIDVADTELVFVYQNKNFQKVLTAGKYAYWKGITQYAFAKADTGDYEIPNTIDRNLLDKSELAAFVRKYKVEAYEKALMFVDGKYQEMLEAGNYIWWVNSTIIQVTKTDIRQLTMEIPGQEILTKDKAQLRVNFTIQYKVTDVVKALLENKEFEKQLYVLMQLFLRELIGRMSFDELMDSKDKIAETIVQSSLTKVGELGVSLLNCGVKDIILPGDVKDIMNQVLIAEKKAQANIITRREETASTRSLLNTAKLMEDNAMLYKLKEMEYVEKIAEKINTISLSGGGQIVDQLKQIFVKQ